MKRREIHARPDRPWRRWGMFALVGVLVVVVGGSAFALWQLNANITRIDVSSAIGRERPTQAAGTTGAVNPLLIGSDTREGSGNDTYADNDGTVGDAHSDTNLLVHLSADRNRATVVSIPRDSMTLAPPDCAPNARKDDWRMRQWNQNYRIGGTGCLIRTLEGNTGLFVDHYAVVDFRGFRQMVDALDGVDVCTTEPIDDFNTHLQLSAGRHTLDGRQALQYVRVRKSVGDGSDLGRIERQQAFLASVMQGATSAQLLAQPPKLYSFLDAATKSLTTDPDFDLGTMRDLASSVKGIGLDQIQFVTVPHEVYEPDPNRVQWAASANELWSALREDRPVGGAKERPGASPSPVPSPLTAAPDDITVHVVNASGTAGLARQARSALEVQGFVVEPTTNGPTVTQPAVIKYSGANAEAARTVAAAFPGATVAKAAGLGETVRVTLGQGAPSVVEVENRTGSEPVPSPSITTSPAPGSLQTRQADSDICS